MLTEDVYTKLQEYCSQLAWRRSPEFIEDVVQDACELLLRWPPVDYTNKLLFTVCRRALYAALRQIYSAAEVLGDAFDELCEQLVDESADVEQIVYTRELWQLVNGARAKFSKLAFGALTDYFFHGFSNSELEKKYGGRSAMQVVFQQKEKLAKLLFSARHLTGARKLA